MRLETLLPVAFVLSLTPLLACGPADERPLEAPSVRRDAVTGDVDIAHTFAVGVYRGTPVMGEVGSAFYSTCSGTLIAANAVLTARHCTSEIESVNVYCPSDQFGAGLTGTYWVTTSAEANPMQPQGWHRVSSIVFPAESLICGNDIAILILEAPVPQEEASPIEPVGRYSMTDHARYGLVHAMIGYGAASPSAIVSGSRRILSDVPIECIPGDPALDCSPISTNHDKEFLGGDGVCGGDSGSGSYEQALLDAGTPVTMGVLSRAGECESSRYTRTDVHWPWIRDTVLQAASDAGSAAPDWAIAEPEPGPSGAGGAGGAPAETTSVGGDSATAGGAGPAAGTPDDDDAGCSVGGTTGASDGAWMVPVMLGMLAMVGRRLGRSGVHPGQARRASLPNDLALLAALADRM